MEMERPVSSQQVLIDFANFYRRFIKDLKRIATSLTSMLKITGSFFALAFRVDDNEVVGADAGARAEYGKSTVKQKASSIILDNWLDSQKSFYKSPRRICRLCGRVLSRTDF